MKYLTRCRCGGYTTRAYARQHDGQCKACEEGGAALTEKDYSTREARVIDAGWEAYAREEGHYDEGGDR